MKPYHCTTCGRRYSRRNSVEEWIRRAPGKRLGWEKIIVRTCLNCQTVATSRRVVHLASEVVPRNNVRPFRRRKAS